MNLLGFITQSQGYKLASSDIENQYKDYYFYAHNDSYLTQPRFTQLFCPINAYITFKKDAEKQVNTINLQGLVKGKSFNIVIFTRYNDENNTKGNGWYNQGQSLVTIKPYEKEVNKYVYPFYVLAYEEPVHKLLDPETIQVDNQLPGDFSAAQMQQQSQPSEEPSTESAGFIDFLKNYWYIPSGLALIIIIIIIVAIRKRRK